MSSSLQVAVAVAVLLAVSAAGWFLAFSPSRRDRLRRLRALVTLLQVADPQVRIETLERVHVLPPRERAAVAGLLRGQMAAASRGSSSASPEQLVTAWFIRQILALLSDSRTAVRGDAARVLRAVLGREQTRPEGEKDDGPVAHAVAAAVEVAGGRALSASADARQQTRVLAFAEMLEAGLRPLAASIQAMEKMSEEALAPLTSALRDRSPRVRRTLCEVLGAMGGERAVGLLVPLLQDPSPEIRARAAKSLGDLKATGAASELTRLLLDPIGEVRAAAASALGEVGRLGSCPSLIQALGEESRREDPCEPARAALIEAVARLADGGRSELANALASLPRPIASRLAVALERAGAVSRWIAGDKEADGDGVLSSLLGGASRLGISRPLLDALDDSEDYVRLRAAAALGRSQDSAALPALAGLLNDPEAGVRCQAACSLAALSHPLAIRPLVQAAADPDASVRLAALSALRRLLEQQEAWRGEPLPSEFDLVQTVGEGQRAAIAAARDEEAAVRQEAAQALSLCDSPQAAEALVEFALTEPDKVVADTAINALVSMKGLYSRRLVIGALEDADDDRRARAVRVVAALGEAAAGGHLVEALHDPSPKVAEAALAGLASGELKIAAGRLIPELRHLDPRVRAMAASHLGRSRAGEGVEPLVEALADPDEEVRANVLSALSAMGRLARKHESAIRGRLTDPSPRVRAAANAALNALRTSWAEPVEPGRLFPEGPLSPEGAAALVEMAADGELKPLLWALNNADSAQSVAVFLAGEGREKLEPLLSALRGAGEWDRVRAIAALSDALRRGPSADGYIAELRAISPGVRLTAVELAGMLGTAEAVSGLIGVLERDPIAEVRSRAASALAGLGGEPARAALVRAREEDPNEVVRVVAARALERPGHVSGENLSLAANDASEAEIRWAEPTPSGSE